MSNTESYAGCFVASSQNEGKGISIKGKIVNDTDIIYSGKVEHNRLIPRRMKAYCNTYTAMEKDAAAHLWFRGGAIVLCATVEQKECVVNIKLNGQSLTVQAKSGIFARIDGLKGEQELEMTVETGTLLFDCAVITGRGDVTFIGGANGGYISKTAGFKRDGFAIVGAQGERAEIWAMGSRAELMLDGNGRAKITAAGYERCLNIDSSRRVHIPLADDGRFNFVRIEVEK